LCFKSAEPETGFSSFSFSHSQLDAGLLPLIIKRQCCSNSFSADLNPPHVDHGRKLHAYSIAHKYHASNTLALSHISCTQQQQQQQQQGEAELSAMDDWLGLGGDDGVSWVEDRQEEGYFDGELLLGHQ
jgi:hypothetical protein